MHKSSLEHNTFLLLLVLVSIAFILVLLPFYGAVFWAVILSIIFAPLHRRLQSAFGRRRNLAALSTLLVCIVLAVLPMIIILSSLVQQGALVYELIRSGKIDFGQYAETIRAALPQSIRDLADRYALGDFDFASLRERLSQTAMAISQFIANRAVNIGQNTFQFVISFFIMLYLLFFLFRDGAELSSIVREAMPLEEGRKQQLLSKFTTVVRATVKGNVIVAITQGFLGGLIFWVLGIQAALLWGVLMAFLSLLPAVGAGLVWTPVAIYFLVTGSVWQGVALILYGIFVIGLVDNVLRPTLVGKDTKMPDYVVLISTLGGMALFGLNGFVIGPLIAALFMATWALFANSSDGDQSRPSVLPVDVDREAALPDGRD